MKKIVIGTLSAMLFMGITASAHSYNNSAFIGKWQSVGATDTDKTELYISYMDTNNISVNFRQISGGIEAFDFTEYMGKVKNEADHIEASLKFDYTDEYGTTKGGHMEMGMYMDNIWLTAYSDSGIPFYNQTLKPVSQPLNPFANPFSSKFKVKLNGEEQFFTSTKPFIVQGTTYVPLRGILDNMNLNVYWDDITNSDGHLQYITTTRNSKIMQFSRTDTGKGYSPWTLSYWDEPDTYNNPDGTIDISEHQPIIIDGTSYVPLRVLSEAYGSQVGWDDSTKTVSIIDDIASDTKKASEDEARVQKFTASEAEKTAKGYVGMVRYSDIPYYTYNDKYFIYVQENKPFKISYTGSVNDFRSNE